LVSGSSQITYSGLTGVPVGIVSSSTQITGYNIFATTGSNQFNGSQAITGSLTVTGQVVAQTLNVQQVTSSIVFSSGSNIFGNSLGNTQQFTGSVSVTGSLTTSIAAFGSAATTFLTSDSGTIKSRTAAQTLSDIAALPLAGGTLTGALSVTAGRINLNGNASDGKAIMILGDATYPTAAIVSPNTGGTVLIAGQSGTGMTIGTTGEATFSSNIAAKSSITVSNNGGENVILSAVSAFADGYRATLRLWNQHTGGKAWEVYSTNDSDGVYGGGRLAFVNSTNSINAMAITSVGNIGIGTVSPTDSRLQIKGANNTTNAYADGLKVTSNNETVFAQYSWAGINANDVMRFATAGTERMRITSSGSVGVGVTPKDYASTWTAVQVGNFALMGPNPSADANAIIGANTYRATDSTWRRIIGGYANLIELNQGSGDIRTYTGGTSTADSTISFVNGPFVANGGVSWTNGSSDVRKKKNFEPSQGLAEVLQIEPVKYHFNWDKDNDKKRLGFKAQNILELIPEMISETGELAEDGTSYLTLTPDYLLPVLVKAIQELKSENDNLKSRLEVLEQS
jgi:hypothetical protein